MIKDRKVWADAIPWPLPNVWLGVSAEDQARANERIPHLLTTPAAVRFVSLEPLLGPIDLTHLFSGDTLYDALVGMCEVGVVDAGDRYVAIDPTYKDCGKLAQVIVGGESGPNARPMHPDWPRQIRDDCAGANVPFFFKQWGHFAPFIIAANERARQIDLLDGCQMIGVGKKAAGRLLDGVEHNGMPAEASA